MPHHIADLARLPASELERIILYGETPDFAALDGYTFRGANITMPGSLMFPRFAKGFYTENGRRMGYNLPVERGPADYTGNGVGIPWKTKPAEGAKAFGFYEVCSLKVGEKNARYPNAVLLDYGKGGNAVYQAERLLRDFVVQVEPNNPDLYLGTAYLDLGVWVPVGYFAIERWQKGSSKPR